MVKNPPFNFSWPLPPRLCRQVHSLHLCLHFFSVNRFISTIFLDSTCMHSVQFSSVAQSCLTLCDRMDCSMPGFPVHHQLPKLIQTHVHQLVMPSNHLILCRPLLLPLSIFPSIKVFSNESVLCIRWPKCWH